MPVSFCRWAGCVWMNSLLTVGISRSPIRPRLIAHPHAGEQVHRLFGADRLGRPQDAVGPAHAVVQRLLAFANEKVAGLPLVVDQHRHDVGDLLGELFFALAERDLVADLVEVARAPASLRRTGRGRRG